jgi:AraC-like DNA-binding protein
MRARSRSAPVVHDPPARGVRHRGPQMSAGYRQVHSWELPFPEFPAFTHVNEADCAPTHVLAPHRHRHLEICYIAAGRAEWTVGGRRHRLRPGDFFLAWPGEVHAGLPDPRDPNRNFAVGFDPARLPLAGALGAGGDLLAALAQLEAQPERLRVVHGGHGAERILRALLAECDAAAGAPPLRRLLCLAQAQALLIELLVLVCRCALRQRLGPAHDERRGLDGLDDWLRARLAAPPSVAAMAAWAGLSPSRLTERCRAAHGCTPLELVTRLRVEEAARRLAADPALPVTQVALDLGFSSPQYFATVFRRTLGHPPTAWQAEPLA